MSEGRSDTVISPSTPPHRIPDSPSAVTLQLAPSASTVWAMEYSEGLLLLGCSDGRIEIWDATNGTLKVNSIAYEIFSVNSMFLLGIPGIRIPEPAIKYWCGKHPERLERACF